MGRFLDEEKKRYREWKAKYPDFSKGARKDGEYRSQLRDYCLPIDCAVENLYHGIRHSVRDYFAKFKIKWHDGKGCNPSNHLCDSQVCCINFLFPFAAQPDSPARVLLPVYPDLARMLPIENDQYVACEWIGQENYLGEKISRNSSRTRGANYTSADAAVLFQRQNGTKQLVLIEWKYTETYSSTLLKMAKSGTDRTKIYHHLYTRADCPVRVAQLSSIDALFYEPFYQLFRQQLLAHEMERARELEADVVSVLHIAPARNCGFRRITSPSLVAPGRSVTEVWKELVCDQSRFVSVSTEWLFGKLSAKRMPEMTAWLFYIGSRYPWIYNSH